MRLLAIGDIHGCSRALDVLLEQVKPTSEDRLVTLGDYVDRGPDSAGVLDRLIALTKTTQLVPLLGNHDQMMLDSRTDLRMREDWLGVGGRETLQSYAKDDSRDILPFRQEDLLADVPDRHWQFLEQTCVPYYETEGHIFVHASLYPDDPLEEQPGYMLRWEKFNLERPHVSGKQVICGHTVQRSGKPSNYEFAVCIDTWVYGAGWLTCLDVINGEFWQANQQGESVPASSIHRLRLSR